MVPNIIYNNKTNIETLYQKISYFPDFQIIISTWYSHSALMSNEEFIIELELLLQRIKSKKANKVILNFRNFDFFISPTDVNKYLEDFSDQISSLKINKLAILPPSNNMIKISIDQAIDRIQMIGNFSYRTFYNQTNALKWIKE